MYNVSKKFYIQKRQYFQKCRRIKLQIFMDTP